MTYLIRDGGERPFEALLPKWAIQTLRASGMNDADAFASAEAVAVALAYPSRRTVLLLEELGVPADGDAGVKLRHLAERLDGEDRLRAFVMIFGVDGLRAAIVLAEEITVTQPLPANAFPDMLERVRARVAEQERLDAERAAAQVAAAQAEASTLLAVAELTGNQGRAIATWLRHLADNDLVYNGCGGCAGGCGDAADLLDPAEGGAK